MRLGGEPVYSGSRKTRDGAERGRYTGARPGRTAPFRNDRACIMPITILDIILLTVMLISGLLAMIRGFMREILSIAAWATAAIATLYFYPQLSPMASQYFNNDIVGKVVVIAGVFLGTLIIVSVLTIRLSDLILDSRIGALDRTLGFLFGLGRGLIIVVVAFLFFDWLVPQKSQPAWISGAKSKVVLTSTGDWLKSLLPDDPENTILKRLKRPRPEDGEEPGSDQRTPGQRSDTGRGETEGYVRSDRAGMQKLIESRAAQAR